ncbi:ATP synthase F1, gamma subunit [Rhizophagus irregularis]|uniref:ATP synthase subunit gamma n=4 Tax=Rhizophagus irregularis TaxID=588596 RepID=A0A2I1DSE7_9GLOM|nr:ATP synthase F1, gamma subunit [Rhizophagus irregularis DAOM 181602=DAOM 197198]EXX69983.1 Atp3p [Rhizophagus irregularis DAOM 197198w]PKC14391.1 ATP synthase F1, gamma subunit [Rhizophagus irregularis]PKC75375.1 ATP synthase F1, gamma subunit [Rhizophagus irregularis]PKY12769.1 ATP synthase F1, gamma subunit [Rhizophagus irregularis]POG73547.1 ATP synthase F1, gamma subunit [Rhizophagus irregularis DAOM 181602=DAOM 197198]|eukprot:XP_025180413.1 ATP synthase F1, gamma subunit [Rhizophagus irregularis DAOM 181602=DAOM 197198]
MFTLRAIRPVVVNTTQSIGYQNRNYATLKEIQLRLKSINSIAKITKSMKMIASTKMTRAQKAMEIARVFGTTQTGLFTYADTKPTEGGNTLVITVSSDRGLCGGIHSSVSKRSKKFIEENPSSQIIVLGDKAKGQLQRTVRENIKLSFNQIGRSIPTYNEASSIADTILKEKIDFDQAAIIYNYFISVISYEAKIIPAFSVSTFAKSGNFDSYEVEDDVLEHLQEFAFANSIYWGLVEGHAAEMASKRSAMENATKNAGEIIEKLTMTYNRGRQAAITNELVDIITGASAL